MYKVYAIYSKRGKRIYVGMTKNLARRLKEHNSRNVFSTKGFVPWILVYEIDCETRTEARKMEKKLKSGYGKEFLKRLI